MIVGKDVHPERKIYYLSALILKGISATTTEEINVLSIYEELNEAQKVTINSFALALDWLFLLGAVKYDNGYIEKCF